MTIKEFLKHNWKKILLVGIVIMIVIVIIPIISIVLIILGYAIKYFLVLTVPCMSVPCNPNFSIPSDLKPENIIPTDLGGRDYSESIFDKSIECYSEGPEYLFSWDNIPGNDSEKFIEALQNFEVDWIKTAKIEKIDNGKTIKVSTEKNFLSLRLDDENNIVDIIDDNDVVVEQFIVKTEYGKLNIYGSESVHCSEDPFIKGYMRAYNTYSLENGTSLKGSHSLYTSRSFYYPPNDLGDNTVYLMVIEYGTPNDAESFSSYLTVDDGYPQITINDVKIIGLESKDDSWARYVLPSGKFVINIDGDLHASKDAISRIIELYKK